MARILGVNGIHNWSWSKDSFTDKLLDSLSDLGHETIDVHYARMWALLAYFNSAVDRRAMAIVKVAQPGDIVIAHSFGCYATVRAMQKGASFDKVFFFAAACEPDIDIPDGAFGTLYNIHSPDDRALKLGRSLPGHVFGALGMTGYTGSNKRVINIEAKGYDHNDYVTPRHLCHWTNFIESRIP